ncbi:hypothetical protein DSUL_100224 [Desulfovibrionales bacterium]
MPAQRIELDDLIQLINFDLGVIITIDYHQSLYPIPGLQGLVVSKSGFGSQPPAK